MKNWIKYSMFLATDLQKYTLNKAWINIIKLQKWFISRFLAKHNSFFFFQVDKIVCLEENWEPKSKYTALLGRFQCKKFVYLFYSLPFFSLMKLSLAISYSKLHFHFSKKTAKQFSQLIVSSPAPHVHSINFKTSITAWHGQSF